MSSYIGVSVEVSEIDISFCSDDKTLPKNGIARNYQECYDKAVGKAGIKDKGTHLKEHLEKAGFEDVKVVIKKLPIGMWPKNKNKNHLGQWGLATGERVVRSRSSEIFTRYLGMSANEVEIICAGTLQEFRRPDVHAHLRYWFVSGRKPETALEKRGG